MRYWIIHESDKMNNYDDELIVLLELNWEKVNWNKEGNPQWPLLPCSALNLRSLLWISYSSYFAACAGSMSTAFLLNCKSFLFSTSDSNIAGYISTWWGYVLKVSNINVLSIKTAPVHLPFTKPCYFSMSSFFTFLQFALLKLDFNFTIWPYTASWNLFMNSLFPFCLLQRNSQ